MAARRPIPVKTWWFLAAALLVMIGGWFIPILGLAVPVIMVLALVTKFIRPRWFCAKACPRAAVLSHLGPRVSRYRKVPAWLYSDGMRQAGCAFLLVCFVGQTLRLASNFEVLGRFFWAVCVVTFALSLLLAVLYKPRAWCAVCPLGTLQTMTGKKIHERS